MKGSEVRQP